MDPEKLVLRAFRDLEDETKRFFDYCDTLEKFKNKVSEKLSCKNFRIEEIAEIMHIMNTVLIGTVKQNTFLEHKLKCLPNLLKPKIEHFGSLGTRDCNFKFIRGHPWNLWLQDIGSREKLHTLLKECKTSELKKLPSVPSIDDYVCYVEYKQIKRGIVLGFLESNRVKLQDLDTSITKYINQDSVYELDSTLCRIHALALNCCLSEEFHEKTLWTDDVQEIFKTVMENEIICVNIMKQSNDSPLFLVNMHLKDEEGTCINVNKWVYDRILPELQNIFDRGLKPPADYLSPEAGDAFFNHPADECYNKVTSSGSLQNEMSNMQSQGVPKSSKILYLEENILSSGESNDKCERENRGNNSLNLLESEVQIMPSETFENFLNPKKNSVQKYIKKSEDVIKNSVVVAEAFKSLNDIIINFAGNSDKTDVDIIRSRKSKVVRKSQCRGKDRNLSCSPISQQFSNLNPNPVYIPIILTSQQYSALPVRQVSKGPNEFNHNIVPSYGYAMAIPQASITIPEFCMGPPNNPQYSVVTESQKLCYNIQSPSGNTTPQVSSTVSEDSSKNMPYLETKSCEVKMPKKYSIGSVNGASAESLDSVTKKHEILLHKPSAITSYTQDYENASKHVSIHVDLKGADLGLVEGAKYLIIMAHIDNPWKFYVHFPTENNTYIEKLKEDMTQFYTICMLPFISPYPWDLLREIFGKYCACRVDCYWYRVEVLNMNHNGVQVFLVDYGKEETVSQDQLQPLHKDFAVYTMMAQRCHLADVYPVMSRDNVAHAQFFRSLINKDTPCKLRAVSLPYENNSNSLGVTLFDEADGTTSVNEMIVREGFATPLNENHDHSNKNNEQESENVELDNSLQASNCKLNYDSDVVIQKMSTFNKAFNELSLPDIGESLLVSVAAVHYPICFHIQIEDETHTGYVLETDLDVLETLTTLENSINKLTNVNALQHITGEPKVSELVLVRDEDTDVWYRAQICEHDPKFNEKGYTVQFVDYGTVDGMRLENMRQIEERHLKLPFQAIECELANVKLMKDKDVNQKATFVFTEEFSGRQLQMHVLNRKDNVLYVRLISPEKGDVGEWLCSRGLCELK